MEIFINLSVIVLFAVIISGIMKLLKQPLLIGYIITGIIVGPYFLDIMTSAPIIEIFSQIGVALLLFMVGLYLNPKIIKDVGKISVITGIGQVLFTSIIGFGIAKVLGFSNMSSLYISVALTFSSTIIIMKLLSDKDAIDTLYGKISIGFLIVQDLLAIFTLMFISSMSNGENLSVLINTFFKGIVALFAVSIASYFFLPKITHNIAKSQEFLLLFSVGWCFALASLFEYLGFSLEIGALLAGVTISLLPYNQEIHSKMKPLRDFFIVLFFIMLGSQMAFGDITKYWISIIVFSLFILIGNPLIVMILMGILGYTKRNSFFAGLTVAQISEFSLILIVLGIKVGHLSQEILSLVTSIGLITIAGSTYLILYAEKIYPYFSKYLSVFEKKNIKKEREIRKEYDAILFGYNRIGFGILNSLKQLNKKYLVVDYNPDTIFDLKNMGIPALYGDSYDIDLLNDLNLNKIELAVSTIPDIETNMLLIESIRLVNKNAIIVVRAHSIDDALNLYKKGASYVLTPHFLGGEYISKMISQLKTDSNGYKEEKQKHIKMLLERMKRGHEHPEVERN